MLSLNVCDLVEGVLYLCILNPIRQIEMPSIQEIGEKASRGSNRISNDEIYDLLANQRRRFTVHLLKREEQSVNLGEMAEQIAAWENGVDATEITGNERKRVYTALQQSHLPKMDSAGVINFNKRRGVVEPTVELQNIDLYIDVVEGREIPWSDYYLGLSGVALALVAAVWIGAWPFTLLPPLTWTLAIVVAFVFSAIMHKYYTAEMKVGEPEEPPELQ